MTTVVLAEQLRVPAEAASVSVARHWVRDQVAPAALPSDVVRDLELITSEIMTAAVQAGEGEVSVRVTVDEFAIRVDVTEHLEARALDSLVDGIDVVHAVSAEWDWRPTSDGGKTVWALLIRDL